MMKKAVQAGTDSGTGKGCVEDYNINGQLQLKVRGFKSGRNGLKRFRNWEVRT